MDTPIWLSKTLNDIVFDGRNKSYGAFALRRDYDRNMTLAILISVCFFLLILKMPSIIHNLLGESIEHVLVDIPIPPITLDNMIKEKQISKPAASSKIKSTPPRPRAQIKFVPVSVVRDDSPKDDLPPTLQEIKAEIIGTNTTEEDVNGIDPGLIEGQDEESGQEVIEDHSTSGPLSIFAVEQKPEFPDGELAMRKYIQDHLHIPLNEVTGQINILIQFIVDKDGNVTDVNVIRGEMKSIDREAANVVRGMPRWKPGKQNGKPVSVIMTLPIKIQFQ